MKSSADTREAFSCLFNPTQQLCRTTDTWVQVDCIYQDQRPGFWWLPAWRETLPCFLKIWTPVLFHPGLSYWTGGSSGNLCGSPTSDDCKGIRKQTEQQQQQQRLARWGVHCLGRNGPSPQFGNSLWRDLASCQVSPQALERCAWKQWWSNNSRAPRKYALPHAKIPCWFHNATWRLAGVAHVDVPC